VGEVLSESTGGDKKRVTLRGGDGCSGHELKSRLRLTTTTGVEREISKEEGMKADHKHVGLASTTGRIFGQPFCGGESGNGQEENFYALL